MRITNFATDATVTDDIIDNFLIDLDERDAKYYIIEDDFEDDLNIDTGVVLDIVSATISLQRLNRTLKNLKIDNNLNQDILFEVLTSVLRGDYATIDQLQRYFILVADVEAYADKFTYLDASSPIEFSYNIDFYLLGKQHWLTDSQRFAEKIDNLFALRYAYISKQVDFSEFFETVA